MPLNDDLVKARGERTARSVAHATGFSPSYLSDIEHGLRVPPPETIRRLAKAMGAKPRPLLAAWAEENIDAGALMAWMREIGIKRESDLRQEELHDAMEGEWVSH